MGYQWGICAKEAKTAPSPGKIMATVFLEFAKNNPHRLSGKGYNYQRCILLIVIEPFENRAARKTPTIGPQKSLFLSRQRISTHLDSWKCKINGNSFLTLFIET